MAGDGFSQEDAKPRRVHLSTEQPYRARPNSITDLGPKPPTNLYIGND